MNSEVLMIFLFMNLFCMPTSVDMCYHTLFLIHRIFSIRVNLM